MLKIIYTIFLGLLLATFVGVGIAAFYPTPKAPEYPAQIEKLDRVAEPTPHVETAEEKQARQEYERLSKEHQAASKIYYRNVSIISLIAAAILLAIGLVFIDKIQFMSDGILFGGVLLTLYSIGNGFATDDNRYRFLAVTVGLIIALVLGYLKFVKHEQKHS